MKNKIVWFLFLIFVFLGIILLNNIDSRVLAGSINILNYTPDGFDEFPMGMALFMEAFCSIHMSVFVLMPLSKIFFKDNFAKAFITMFVIRVVFLLLFNFITTYIAVFDFLLVFFGAFIVVPISAALTSTKLNHRSNQVIEYNIQRSKSLESKVFNDAGVTNLDVLKKVLVMQYADINRAFYAKDVNKIKKLCSPGVYMDYKTKWEMYDRVLEVPKIEDVDFYEVEFSDVNKYDSETFIDLHIKYTCIEYSIDMNNNIVRGSRDKYKMVSKLLTFSKKQSDSVITECPNCGASVSSDDENCEYCNTEINFKVGEWILKSEKTIYEGIKE